MLNKYDLESILGHKTIKVLISSVEIQKRIEVIANKISEDFKNRVPIIIGVLNGSFMFMSDLVRKLNIQYEIDFIKVSSYGNSRKSSGTVRLIKDISADIRDRDIILIEDIVDTGLSLTFLKKRFEEAYPKSLTFVTLLHKPKSSQINFNLNYIGFEIGNDFVVGYGLDYKQKLRGLPSIYTLSEE